MTRFILLFVMLLAALPSIAQNTDKVTLRGQIVDDKSNTPQEFAVVYMENQSARYSAMSDKNGMFVISGVKRGTYKLTVSFLGYDKLETSITLKNDRIVLQKEDLTIETEGVAFRADEVVSIYITSSQTNLDEVVVTGVESKSIISSTVIDRRAMEHLQPSSFTDLLGLLPGGKASDPVLTSSNVATIREVGRADKDYDISSLGTSFLIDGIPISTNANMQYTTGAQMLLNGGGYADDSRSMVNRGIDMRSISTDQIERVEVVRGLASVRYGDLTSGLVKIERKRGVNPFEARFKVDGLSKLLALGKGLYVGKNTVLNLGFDYLDSKANPTNNIENYQRINLSARLSTEWDKSAYRLRWNTNVDFGHTLDKEKVDPEVGYDKVDKYKSTYNRFAFNNTFEWILKKSSFIRSLEVLTSASYELDKIEQTKLVQITSPTAIPNTTEQGESDGIYLPSSWISELTVDGRPLSLYAQINGKFSVKTFSVINNIQVGAEWSYDKNLGDGQVYDITRPPSSGMSTRPRKYSDIPASQNVAFYVEDDVNIPFGKNRLRLNAGIRAMSMLNLDSQYKMNGKYYFDPRFNAEWTFPSISINQTPLIISAGSGLGWQSKNPTLSYLYPDWAYNDIVQLNYYHNNPAYRRINMMTYKNKLIGYNLEPSHNKKWEVKLNMSYDNNNFTITYFQEKMTNGFRYETTNFQIQNYKIYDPNSVNSTTLTGPPDLAQMTYTTDTLVALYSLSANGTVIKKQGIEFAFSSKRIEALRTRITFNGAWFKSDYENSIPTYRGAQRSINGGYIKERGIYESDSKGMTRELLNTNLMFDTYIPVLDFIFSTSFQCSWFTLQQSKEYSGMPYAYIDREGNIHPYTEAELNDPYLSTLYNPVSPTNFEARKIPFAMDVNFKMSKMFKDKVKVSVFVNRLLDYRPDYTVNGHTYHRNVSPYFGAELSLTL